MEVMDLVAVAGAVLFFLLLVVSFLHWGLLVFLVLVSSVAQVHIGLNLGIKLDEMQVTLYPVDALAVVAGAAAVIRLFIDNRLDSPLRWWIAVCACWFFALAYGASRYGAFTALSFYRQHFYLCAIALYLMTFQFSAADLRRVMAMWIGAAAVVMVFCLLAKIDPYFVNEELLLGYTRQAFVAERVVGASAALVMTQAALIGLGGWAGMRGGVGLRILTICLIIAVLLQYHRSTWLAGIAGSIAMVKVHSHYLGRLAPVFLMVLGCVAVLWLWGVASGEDFMTAAVTGAFSEPLDARQSTALWRIESWRILLGRAIGEGAFRILVGGGFGVGYERLMGGEDVLFSPHNMFVEIFLNAGLVGLLPMIAFFVVLLRQVMVHQQVIGTEPDGLDPAVAAALTTAILVYCTAYSLNYDQGILLGVMASALGSRAAVSRLGEWQREA